MASASTACPLFLQDLDEGMTELPAHVAARLKHMQSVTTGITNTLGAALDTDGHYTRTQVENMLQVRSGRGPAGGGKGRGGSVRRG